MGHGILSLEVLIIELYLGTNWTTIWMVSTLHLHLWTNLLFTSPRISCNSQTLRQVFGFLFFVFLRIIQLFSIAILTNAGKKKKKTWFI